MVGVRPLISHPMLVDSAGRDRAAMPYRHQDRRHRWLSLFEHLAWWAAMAAALALAIWLLAGWF
jgi:hypothetical protein